ncbi:MAG: UDP-glucose 4-epimerase [Gaiellaceae bacterium]|jgi:UDP-glucose 4-epimerase|nr:UDP-glucose 4-epimerase [Gaiellaceae bacterium]
MRAIVTGGGGFIGSHLVDALLTRGDEVYVVDDLSTGRVENLASAAVLLEYDIRDECLRELVADIEPDVIFHLAAQADVGTSVARPKYDADVNVVGTLGVLEAAQGAGARVVFASSGGAIYGERKEPAREDAPRLPMSPYGTAKLAAEEYIAMWNRLHGTNHVVLRLANVYGERQQARLEGGVVAVFLDRLSEGLDCEIYGDGGQTRDFVHVSDVAAAFVAAGDGGDGVFNVGSGRRTTILELFHLCAEATGAGGREPVHQAARAGDLRDSVLDASHAEAVLGWRPRLTLAEGIALTWQRGRIASSSR